MIPAHSKLGGRYQVIDLLGKGGMGEVYLATDEVLSGKAVALKVVTRHVEAEATLDELRREVLLAQQVTHRNVCRIYDLEKIDDRWMIKMEWIAGETLANRIARGRLEVDEVLGIARQIADGLEAAHRERVIHRDLKSSNVMIEESTGRVVVLDFGIALAASSDAVSDRAGTPAFMAPEQVRGAQLDSRSDVFALGCVLYHMLVGEVAFPASTLDTAVRVVASHGALPDPRARRPDVPPWLARAVMRMLAPDPDARPQDAAALKRLLAGPRRYGLAIATAVAGALVTAVAVVAVVTVVTRPVPRRTWKPLIQELEPAYDENVDSVAFSPDGTRIAFSSDRERPGLLRGRVRTVRGPGADKDEVAVTPPDKNALFVTFTHDGTSLLFTDIGDNMSTWRVRIDGSAPAEKIGAGYAIDCGGKLLRFEFSSPGCPNCPRFVVRDERAGGNEREVLRLDSQAFVSTYRCDLAGTRFVWGRAEQGAPFYQPSDLWIADVATGTARRLTTDRRRNSYPSFTPDGRSIVFASARGGGVTNLWEMPLDGGAPVQLTFGDGNDLLPDVSPDGTMVAFSVDVSSAPLFAHTGAGARTRVTPARVILIHPQATPDGREVVAADYGPLEPRIVAVSVADGSVRALASGAVATVTTDGKDVVVASGGDHAVLSLVPLAGGVARPLAGPLDGRVRAMRAGPDRVVHVMLDREATIEAWRVPLDGGAASREADAPWCFVHPAPVGGTTLWTRCSADGPIAGVLVRHGATPDPSAAGLRMDGQLFFGGDFDASGSAYFVYQEPKVDRIDVATGGITTLFEAALFGATVSPDGKTVYSTEAVGRSRRHVITNFAERVRP
ncbi:MAG TPA: protein kinase [Kofleriaceae bacterium]|nr:protein kinase [Kofleriaceae bacterium]